MTTDSLPKEQVLGQRPAAVQLRSRRDPKLIIIGVLLVVLGGLGAAALVMAGKEHRAVVVTARDVSRGHTITQEDLSIIELPSSALGDALPADQLPDLIGKTAAVDLPAQSFPLPKHFERTPLPEGQALVGLRLSLGRIPETRLVPGTKVRLVGLEEHSLSIPAVVVTAPTAGVDGSSYSLDVWVADKEADRVAAAMAGDALALIVTEEP